MQDLPWAMYGNTAVHNLGSDGMLGRATIIGQTAPLYQSQADKGGTLDDNAIHDIIHAAVIVRDWLPVKQQMIGADRAYLAAKQKPRPDIWPARDLTLATTAKVTPVVAAVWDSGVDATLFPGQLWTNPRESANGRDDDGNGYFDDIHGIASDRFAVRQVSLMTEVPPDIAPRMPELKVLAVGLRDQFANRDTSAAHRIVAFADQATVAQMAQFRIDTGFFGEYFHGTHVAGIVARGNPALRMLIVKHSFDWRHPPRRPTEAIARAYAESYIDQVAYMKAAGVRVVNMSWTVSVKDEYEDALAENGVPQAEREAEARRLFAIDAGGLRAAIESAPDILFVCAAGNDNNSAAFQGSVPASYELPNVLTVSAVGSDGMPTSFTTTGPTVKIAANGDNVESFVPGGGRMISSGTSMASPQVVNAAAKLLAIDPRLSTAALRRLLIETATPGQDGIPLLNARAAAARLRAGKGSLASR